MPSPFLKNEMPCEFFCLLNEGFQVFAIFGCVCGISNCMSMQYDFSVYAIALFLGAAQAILLITSLSVVAELINRDTVSDIMLSRHQTPVAWVKNRREIGKCEPWITSYHHLCRRRFVSLTEYVGKAD